MNDTGNRAAHGVGDLIYDALFIAGVGGGIVALFFLVFDVVSRGQALFTPSLMGSVLFDGAPPQSVQAVSMPAVAKYSAVHFVAFSLFGLGLSFVAHQAELRARQPTLVIALAFVALEVGFWVGATLAIPGVLERIGVIPVAAANLLAAVGVGAFLVSSHRAELWPTLGRAARSGRGARM